MTTVYIAGPLMTGDCKKNIPKAMRAANDVANAGYSFYLPHVLWYMNNKFPRPEKFWLAEDLKWLEKCDCVLRIPGDSRGADAEVAYAYSKGIPVFHTLEDIKEWVKSESLASLF
jgi:nucleoside 2-deoxyribosyltransferase